LLVVHVAYVLVLVFGILNFNNYSTTQVTTSSASHFRLQGKGKGKAIPLQVWIGPEGSRRLRLPDFKTIGT